LKKRMRNYKTILRKLIRRAAVTIAWVGGLRTCQTLAIMIFTTNLGMILSLMPKGTMVKMESP